MDPMSMPQSNDQKEKEQININVPPVGAFKSDFQPQKSIDMRRQNPAPFQPGNPVNMTKIPDIAAQTPVPPPETLPFALDESSGKPFKMIMAGTIIFLTIILVAGVFIFKKGNTGVQPANSPVISQIPALAVDPNLDSDKDGIPDRIEKVIGTDPYKADTDGDGYSDLQEIKSGYSPLIAGPAGKYTPEQWQILKDKIKAADEKFYESVFGTPSINSSPNPTSSPAASQTPL